MFRIVFLLTLTFSFVFPSDSSRENFIDKTHSNITSQVKTVSGFIDSAALKIFDFVSDINKKDIETKAKAKNLNPKSIDELFQNDKYFEETNNSYLKLSSDYQSNSIGVNEFNVNLSARLTFDRSKENLKLYMSGLTQDNLGQIFKHEDNVEDTPEIGLSYISKMKKNLDTKYSIGIRSLDPFVKANIVYKTKIKSWEFETIQNFRYSFENDFKERIFEEDTKVYFDKDIIEKVLFRLELGRGTNSDESGMYYDTAMHLFWTPQSKTGLQLMGAAYGDTNYTYTQYNGLVRTYNGINNYVAQVTLRQNIYRKWLFYQLTPGVNFSKSNDYKANYRFYIRLDMFFGKM